MKRILISGVLMAALGFAGVAQADGYRGEGYPPGIQKQLERGKALPPGQQKKFLRSEWRDRDDRHYGKKHRHDHRDRHEYRDRDHHRDRNAYRDRNSYRDRKDHHHYRDGYRAYFSHNDRLAPEHRVARIIRDTQILLDHSRR